MCTAISVWGKRHLFGRTLDLARTYGEAVVLTPRRFSMEYVEETHYALLGVAHLFAGEPLYYDAVNEHGLAAAALNFPGEAFYHEAGAEKIAIPAYALIPWVLSRAKTLEEAVALLGNVTVTGEAVDSTLPTTPLHWILADKSGAVTVESLAEGFVIAENTQGVLTNAPRFGKQLALVKARGVEGDLSSTARFGRAAFYKTRTVVGESAEEAAADFLHLMETVSVPKGAVTTPEGELPYTQYTACADTCSGTCFYTTYGCRRIRAVTMRDKDLDGRALYVLPLSRPEDVLYF